LVETYQTKDGKIEIPEAIRDVFGAEQIG